MLAQAGGLSDRRPHATELVADPLRVAAGSRGGLDGAIFHSDRGAQYSSKEFAALCAELGVVQSMGAAGSSGDNAAAESFNTTMKREILQGRSAWPTARHARLEVFRWVSRYNSRRRRSSTPTKRPVSESSGGSPVIGEARTRM
ncbi:hypothetical protein GCM10010412_085820 [Nonomuraea recticatena]|uniref:Integrase catalytic domain-containing protein n=1 Tax=Nonomuraea recticatena TaxID=46178 RepID=A0ABP6FLW6_9ACTN